MYLDFYLFGSGNTFQSCVLVFGSATKTTYHTHRDTPTKKNKLAPYC